MIKEMPPALLEFCLISYIPYATHLMKRKVENIINNKLKNICITNFIPFSYNIKNYLIMKQILH